MHYSRSASRSLAGVCALFTANLLAASSRAATQPDDSAPVRAKYLVTTADDFVIDVYHNGKPVPDARRKLLLERFGATVERINEEVRKGDWLVFHVVNNRMRWGGAYYFAAGGMHAPNEFGFVSGLETGAWSACDDPRDADSFIALRDYLRHRSAKPVANPWGEGDVCMRQYAGANWKGQPVWGAGRSTWLKLIVE